MIQNYVFIIFVVAVVFKSQLHHLTFFYTHTKYQNDFRLRNCKNANMCSILKSYSV